MKWESRCRLSREDEAKGRETPQRPELNLKIIQLTGIINSKSAGLRNGHRIHQTKGERGLGYAEGTCDSGDRSQIVDRGLDPLTTHLAVADESRTEKTICLAVSPSLKKLGLAGRPRLFEVVEKMAIVNAQRLRHAPHGKLIGSSWNAEELARSLQLAAA